MANQIIIDIGATANDGTGDPLRTAFNYVNDNFSNVWNTGLPSSNVLFSGNRILTANTNGNLVLAPNGIGKVVANVDIRPNANNTLSLGSSDLRWNSVYAQNLDVGGNVSFNNVTVGGNLTVQGNIIQVGNIVTETLTIQLANAATTANAANGSGITVGASDNIATLLYNSTSNVWTTNIGMSVTGNVTAPYFIGNGSQLTGVSTVSLGNLEVVGSAIKLANGAPNTNVYLTANGVSGNAYISIPSNQNTLSDGLTIVNLHGRVEIKAKDGGASQSWYFQEDGSLQLPGDVPAHISSDNNISLVTGSGDHWTFGVDGVLTVPGNIVPETSNTQSLGNATNQWSDLWVSNATIYMNSVPIGLTAGNVLTVDGADVVTTANGESSIGNLDIIGTVIEIAEGASDTLINITPSGPTAGWAYLQLPTNDTANTADTRLHNDAGNIEFGTGDFSTGETNYTWVFGKDGTTTLPNYTLLNPINEDLVITAQDEENDGWGLFQVVTDGATNTLSQTRLQRDQFSIQTDYQGSGYQWTFDDSGRLNLPGNINGVYGASNSFYAVDDGTNGSVELKTISYMGDTLGSNIRVTQSNATISTNNAAHTWTFDNSGELTVPGDIQSITTGFAFTADISNVDTTNDPGNVYITITSSPFPGPVTGQVTISDVVGTTQANETWYFEASESDQFQLFNDAALTSPVDGTSWTAYISGGLAVAAGYNDLGIIGSNVAITNNSNQTWTFANDGATIFPILYIQRGDTPSGTISGYALVGGAGDEEFIISTPNGVFEANESAQRLVINPGKGADNTSGEGGDIYLWAGRGGEGSGSGGDIKIRGGQGGANTAGGNGGDGGYIRMEAGDAAYTGGSAGYVQIVGGVAGGTGIPGGYININGGYGQNGNGGDVNVTGGEGGTGYNGGNVNINGGATNNNATYGNVTINSGGNTWTFDNTGKLTLPGIATGGEGEQERAQVRGTRKIIGEPNYWSTYIDGHSDFGAVAWTASSVSIQSAKITFAVQSGGVAANWEQFDVSVCKMDGANAYVSVSGRIKQNSAIADTQVSAYDNEGGLEVWLNPAVGQTVAYINYDAVEFNIMPD